MRRTALAAFAATLLCTAIPESPAVGQPVTPDPGWKQGAVCYEVFVRSFYDSDGDGVGDLNGLTQKLDYINDGTPSARRGLRVHTSLLERVWEAAYESLRRGPSGRSEPNLQIASAIGKARAEVVP
jgi:hypothetical protein